MHQTYQLVINLTRDIIWVIDCPDLGFAGPWVNNVNILFCQYLSFITNDKINMIIGFSPEKVQTQKLENTKSLH